MRKFGIGLLGLFAGLLAGLIVHDVLARVLLDDGMFPDSVPLAILVGFLAPALGVCGIVVALMIDNRRNRRRSGEAR